ncbi:MAG TPA: hypothetical protein PK406_15320 [Verrucomicrobiota bacterium]|nr:hypothetical protein [Verrucomicrobiota bacterium]
MKTNKIIRRFDNALFRLQEAHSLLETKVESADAARVLAVMMQPALDDMFNLLERLMDKAEREAKHA